MFSDTDLEGVLDRLAKSNELQAIQLAKYDFQPPKILLEKMANLHGLRAIHLSYWREDWSALTKIRSLQILHLSGAGTSGLLDNSPFMKAFCLQHKRASELQEWKRSGSERPFQLTKFSCSVVPDDKLCKSLLLEVHLENATSHFSQPLLGVLPRCRSIRSLGFTCVDTNKQVASLSEALLQSPFIHSLSLITSNSQLDFSSLPLSTLKSFYLAASNVAFESVSKALTKSKPNSLTNLELYELTGSFEPLARALLNCPSLTNLTITEESETTYRQILPVIQVLHHLPLTKLTLKLKEFEDEEMEALLAFLSRSAVQDLSLGTLFVDQLQLVADALPSLSCLQSFSFDTVGFAPCQHDSSHLALFSALSSSSLRSLTIRSCSFRLATLEACLDKIPKSQLTYLFLGRPFVFTEGSDGTDDTLDRQSLKKLLDWDTRFPKIKDRFCFFRCAF
jgi:hypothetical protein